MGAVCCGGEPRTKYTPEYAKKLPSLKGKAIAITGCTSGTGFCLAEICIKKGATLFLLNRASGRATAAFEKLAQEAKVVGAPAPQQVDVDLMSFESVRGVRARLEPLLQADGLGGGLDVLVNNAGIMGFKDWATDDGFDCQMQTNFLSHFILTHDLLPLLDKAAELRGEARLVQHSSTMRKTPEGARDESEIIAKYMQKRPEEGLGGDGAYRNRRYQQSKLASLVFASALHDRLVAAGSKVRSFCAHPGVAFTEIVTDHSVEKGCCDRFINSCFAQIAMSATDGAMGILMCTADPDVKAGGFYGPKGKSDPKNKDHDFGEYTGPAELMPEDPYDNRTSRDLLWKTACESTGAKQWSI